MQILMSNKKNFWTFCYVKLLLAADIVVLSTWALVVSNKLQKLENKVWHVFKANNKERERCHSGVLINKFQHILPFAPVLLLILSRWMSFRMKFSILMITFVSSACRVSGEVYWTVNLHAFDLKLKRPGEWG